MRPLDQQICFSLYAASMAITRAYKPLLDTLGLTYPQYLVLSALGEADGSTIGGIAARLDLESSTVTPLVKRLEEAQAKYGLPQSTTPTPSTGTDKPN